MSEQETQVAVTQGDIRAIKKEVETVSEKVNEVHQALIGSPLAKDGGMVQRLFDCELEVDKLRTKIAEVERANQKSELYLKIIWALGGVLVTGSIGYIASHLLK